MIPDIVKRPVNSELQFICDFTRGVQMFNDVCVSIDEVC